MTDQRQHLRGQTYRESRNTVAGKSFLTGSDEVEDVFKYSFALQCSRAGQVPSALIVQQDTYDAVLTDQTGDRSEFWRQFHADVGRRGRKTYGIRRGELFWEHGRPEETVLLDEEAAIEAILEAYDAVLECGGTDQLAQSSLAILPEHWGTEITIPRPPTLTNPSYPAFVTMVPMPPPALMHRGVEGARELVNDRIEERAAAHAEHGAGVVRSRDARRRRPRFAGAPELVAAANDAYVAFKRDHCTAYWAFRDRRRNVVFPAGTVFWRRVANVNVAPQLQGRC